MPGSHSRTVPSAPAVTTRPSEANSPSGPGRVTEEPCACSSLGAPRSAVPSPEAVEDAFLAKGDVVHVPRWPNRVADDRPREPPATREPSDPCWQSRSAVPAAIEVRSQAPGRHARGSPDLRARASIRPDDRVPPMLAASRPVGAYAASVTARCLTRPMTPRSSANARRSGGLSASRDQARRRARDQLLERPGKEATGRLRRPPPRNRASRATFATRSPMTAHRRERRPASVDAKRPPRSPRRRGRADARCRRRRRRAREPRTDRIHPTAGDPCR